MAKIMAKCLIAAAGGLVLFGKPMLVFATAYQWTPTTAGPFYWNNALSQNNWGSDFPNVAGDVANVNTDLSAAETIRLNQAITIGTLNIGDSAASTTSFGFTINNANTSGVSTPANTLTFQGASNGDATAINLGASGTPTNTISANVILGGTSALNVAVAGGQSLTLSGSITTNDNTLSTSGAGTGDVTYSGAIIGGPTAKIIQGSAGSSSISSTVKAFSGTYVVNRGTMLVATGSASNAKDMVLNGYWNSTTGTPQTGGTLTIGSSGTTLPDAPGQRLSSASLTFNGGSLYDRGQKLSTAPAAPTTLVSDTVQTMTFNSAYSMITMEVQTGSTGTNLTATNLVRTAGATASVRSATLGGTTKFLVTGSVGAIGGGGASGSTNMSILPWMTAANTNASAQAPPDFATYISGSGIRSLTSTEYSTSLSGVSDRNVLSSVSTLASDVTVNSLKTNTATPGNIGLNRTLTVASGGIVFGNNGAGIGKLGDSAAGTLAFGTAEGVVWTPFGANASIGAVITGSGGFTKAGSATLTLAGANTYTGLTVVSSGILRVGNGTQTSHLGSRVIDSVRVANGANLQISSADVLGDQATLLLDAYGLFNGTVTIDTGLSETIGGFVINGVQQQVGTWGSTASLATFKNDNYFSGTGVLNVTLTPEPSSLALFGIGGIAALRRRRRA